MRGHRSRHCTKIPAGCPAAPPSLPDAARSWRTGFGRRRSHLAGLPTWLRAAGLAAIALVTPACEHCRAPVALTGAAPWPSWCRGPCRPWRRSWSDAFGIASLLQKQRGTERAAPRGGLALPLLGAKTIALLFATGWAVVALEAARAWTGHTRGRSGARGEHRTSRTCVRTATACHVDQIEEPLAQPPQTVPTATSSSRAATSTPSAVEPLAPPVALTVMVRDGPGAS